MHEIESSVTPAAKRIPWNKGKLTGAKPPLRPKHVWAIRTISGYAPSTNKRTQLIRERVATTAESALF